MDYWLLIGLAAGVIAGAALMYALSLQKLKFFAQQVSDLRETQVRLDAKLLENEEKLAAKGEENLGLQTMLSSLEAQRDMLQQRAKELEGLQEAFNDSRMEVSGLQTRLEEEREKSQEKLALLNEAQEQMKLQFSKLANEIFEQKSKVHAEQNKLQLDTILKPFQEQVQAFGKKIEEKYVNESKERHLLKDQIIQLRSLNERLSDDANNLTKALKGENKTQGNWGELILEKILEDSGLREGHEYVTQAHHKSEEGKSYKPDVIVHLPDEKDIVIDSKVSLVAYERYVNAENDHQRESARKEHVLSLRSHIKGLSEKKYDTLQGVRTLDFVLLFMPIESAFMLALEEDAGFFQDAIKHNIMVVGPSTLLATLRTIEYIWRNERQEQNAQEIAQKAADLYDKFEGFIGDMEKIGVQLGRTQESYDAAMNKLSTGRGNLIKRSEDMKKLGVKPKKQLPENLLEKAGLDEA